MAGPRKKKEPPALYWADGYWYTGTGDQRQNLGRSRRYAEKLIAEKETKKK